MSELVVIVRDAGVGWVVPVAEAVRAAGCLAGLVTSPLGGHEAERLRPLVDVVATVADPGDPEQVAAAVRSLRGQYEIGAVLSASDGVVATAAQAAELLGIGRTPYAGIALSRNKYACRQRLAAAGLPVPRFALLHSAAQAAQVAEQVGLPAVIKPVNGTGSHLVERVSTVDQLADAYRRAVDRMRTTHLAHLYARPQDGVDPTRSFLVESRLTGHEFCLDLSVRDGEIEHLAMADKAIVDDRYFERGFITPPIDLAPEREQRIRRAIDDAVRALGLDNTIAHVEVMEDERLGPTVVEVNAGRPAGELLGMVIAMNTGINTVAELVSVARGAPSPRTPPRLPVPLATLSVYAEESGRLRAVHGIDDVAALPDVIAVVPMAEPGDVITDEYETFAVAVIVAGFADVDDLADTYQRVDSLLRLEITR